LIFEKPFPGSGNGFLFFRHPHSFHKVYLCIPDENIIFLFKKAQEHGPPGATVGNREPGFQHDGSPDSWKND